MTDSVSPTHSPPAGQSGTAPLKRRCVMVCQNRSCERSQSAEVLAAFRQHQSKSLFISASECLGQCGSGPTVRVMPDDTWYRQVRPEDVEEIFEQHLQGNQPVKRLLHPRFHPQFDAHSFNQTDLPKSPLDSSPSESS
ncbi:MAG: (2Fe-2S) ferredoxin domain-containing protein [Cyanobacteria bacterium J06642_9]